MITVHDICSSIGGFIFVIVVIVIFLIAIEIALFILNCLQEENPYEQDPSFEESLPCSDRWIVNEHIVSACSERSLDPIHRYRPEDCIGVGSSCESNRLDPDTHVQRLAQHSHWLTKFKRIDIPNPHSLLSYDGFIGQQFGDDQNQFIF